MSVDMNEKVEKTNLEQREELYIKAIEKWGEYSQLDQCLEEMAELMVAINKYKRLNMDLKDRKQEIMENLVEEIADTKLCIEQMEMMFGKDNVSDMVDRKMKKFKKCFEK